MYAIISNGNLVSLCEYPNYIKKNNRTGVYVSTDEEDAIGIAVCGNLYNINGNENIKDAPQAIVVEHDTSDFVFKNMITIEKNEDNHNNTIAAIEDAMCEMDTLSSERLSSIEDALCELDMAITQSLGGAL